MTATPDNPMGRPSQASCWLLRGEQRGGHVHVGVWCGTFEQAQAKARPKLGILVMSPDQWADLVDLVDSGYRYARADFLIVGPPPAGPDGVGSG